MVRVRTVFGRRALAVGAVLVLAATLANASARAASPSIPEEWAINVAGESATLEASVEPNGSSSRYRFEYYANEDPSAITSTSEEDLVSTGSVTIEASVQGLKPGTAYSFQVVVEGTGGTAEGEPSSFTTQLTGSESGLTDGRAYELVSPVNKQGANIPPFEEGGPVIQAAQGGNAIAYTAKDVLGSTPEGNRTPEYNQILSKRGPRGWASCDLATTNTMTKNPENNSEDEYRLFSPDLSLSLVEPRTEPAEAEGTIYLRNDEYANEECKAIKQPLYQPLVTASNVFPPGQKFGFEFERPGIVYTGASPDLSHVTFISRAPLTSETGLGESQNLLYMWAGGKLKLVSLLPNPATESLEGTSMLGYYDNDVRHAISNDGSKVFWGTIKGGTTHLYMRDFRQASPSTIRVDAAQGVAEPSEDEAIFQLASADGSRVFFTDERRLTPNATEDFGSHAPNLYEFDTETDTLTDLTIPSAPGEHADVLGTVIGTSEDASYLYFVANGALAPGAEPGDCPGKQSPANTTCNLYMLHFDSDTQEWEKPRFIAKLSNEDRPDWEGGQAVVHFKLGLLTARVSPDGRYLAFMSDRSLTGYDSRDAVSGIPDEEVYLYDAFTHQLLCASCNPTGARPAGAFDNGTVGHQLFVDQVQDWNRRWLAASIPGWDGNQSLGKVAQYQPRYLSNSGRLFFDSADALVPQDSNGMWDVYEYAPEGVGGCNGSTTTFVREVSGCVSLVSSGSSREDSAFLDASESGDDAFFLTTAQLVPQDTDTAYDVYDAHVCGAEGVPCFSAPVSPLPCSTSESCKAAPTPQPSIYGAPSSATFGGSVEVPEPVSKQTVKKKKKKKKKAKKRSGAGRARHANRRSHGGPHGSAKHARRAG